MGLRFRSSKTASIMLQSAVALVVLVRGRARPYGQCVVSETLMSKEAEDACFVVPLGEAVACFLARRNTRSEETRAHSLRQGYPYSSTSLVLERGGRTKKYLISMSESSDTKPHVSKRTEDRHTAAFQWPPASGPDKRYETHRWTRRSCSKKSEFFATGHSKHCLI